jgi:hypothetical protein
VDGGRPGLELCGSAAGRRDGARCEGRAAARVWKKAAARVGRTPAPRGSRQQMSCNF